MYSEIIKKNGYKTINLNRRKAIHERCLNCAGWIHKEITKCPIEGCELYPFRTVKGKQNATARNKAIRKYCLWCMNGQVGAVTKCPSSNCPLFIYRKGSLDSTLLSEFRKKEERRIVFKRNLRKARGILA